MKTNINYKVLLTIPVFGLVMNSCKTFYANTFVMSNDNKILLKDETTEEERLIDCSKNSSQEIKQLLSDVPFFKAGDPVKLHTDQRYNGFRVFKAEESEMQYNHDTIQIRKDMKVIEEFKAKADSVKTR